MTQNLTIKNIQIIFHVIFLTIIFLQAHPQIPMSKKDVSCNKKIREFSPNWTRMTKVGDQRQFQQQFFKK